MQSRPTTSSSAVAATGLRFNRLEWAGAFGDLGSLAKVKGVTNVRVSLERNEAVVTFDDTRTSIGALLDATAAAGYTSSPKKQ